MVIFRAKLPQRKQETSHRYRIFLENLDIICLIHGYSDQCKTSTFQELLRYHYKNVDTKLTLTLLNQLHINLESVKGNGATSVHLLWIAKRKTSLGREM